MSRLSTTLARTPRIDQADTLWWQMQAANLTRDWEREYQFHPTRKWRFDLALAHRKIAVEVEGLGIEGTAGRHQRIGGFLGDMEKYAEAWAAGWRVLRVSTKHVKSGQALMWIERALVTGL